jgi:serine/threonine-protein kinase HipA
MSTLAEVKLWGTTIGSILLEDGERYASFEYDSSFSRSGIRVAPLTMPLGRVIYRFPDLPEDAFHGLPGLLADSLPDKFGNALIEEWLARQGRSASSFNAVERLCYTGKRGMGALEFFPALDPGFSEHQKIEIDQLTALASQLLRDRENFQTAIKKRIDLAEQEPAIMQLLQVGTSAGGARAKAVIAWNQETGEIRSGQIEAGSGFHYWLMKFDGVSANRDKELADPQGYTNIEYAYYLMAQNAGINMSECRLLSEQGRSHFLTRRFDRTTEGG